MIARNNLDYTVSEKILVINITYSFPPVGGTVVTRSWSDSVQVKQFTIPLNQLTQLPFTNTFMSNTESRWYELAWNDDLNVMVKKDLKYSCANNEIFDERAYAKGLGLVSSYCAYCNSGGESNSSLSYYKTRVGVWGEMLDFEQIKTTYLNVKNEAKDVFRIYPNPVSGNVYLEAINTDESAKDYCLYNVFGQLVLSGELSGNSIDLAQLPVGVYFLTLSGQLGIYNTKLIKR